MHMKKTFLQFIYLSQFDYCCVVWANFTKSYLKKLYKIQKRTAKLILMKPNRTLSFLLFKTLGWLTFDNRLKYHTTVLVYNALHNQAPKYISDLFVNVSSHKYSLRSLTRGDIIPKSLNFK